MRVVKRWKWGACNGYHHVVDEQPHEGGLAAGGHRCDDGVASSRVKRKAERAARKGKGDFLSCE